MADTATAWLAVGLILLFVVYICRQVATLLAYFTRLQPSYSVYCKPGTRLAVAHYHLWRRGCSITATDADRLTLVVKPRNSRQLVDISALDFVEAVTRL